MHKLSRSLIFLSLVTFIVALSVIPAYAAYDPLDFIVNVSTNEEVGTSTFTAEFPNIRGGFYFIDNGSNTGFNSASSIIKNVSTSHSYGIWYRPFQVNSGISLVDIPAGTRCSIHTYGLGNFPNSSIATAQVLYYSGSTLVQTVSVAKLGSYEHGVFQFQLNPPAGADSFRFLCDFNLGAPSSSGNIAVGFSSFQLLFNLNDLYYEQIQSGKTNKYLSAIEDKVSANGETLDDVLSTQEETNDKLDDIIAGTVTPERPSGSDSFDDLNDAETSLRDDAQSALDEFLELNDITHEGLEPYLTSLFAVSYIFELFADLPFFAVLLGVSLCLGLTGTILGIFHGVQSKRDGIDYAAVKREILERNHKGG